MRIRPAVFGYLCISSMMIGVKTCANRACGLLDTKFSGVEVKAVPAKRVTTDAPSHARALQLLSQVICPLPVVHRARGLLGRC